MRKVLALIAVVALGGCASASAGIAAEKALIAAHTFHDAAVAAATAAYNTGKCVADCKVKVQKYLDDSEKLLVDADGLSDPTNILADVTAATALINDAKGMF